MANPQVEHGHIRIANEIIDEVLRRDFSKRQQSILHFIWRLSYGTNKKWATIPRLKDFALCGVSQQNVRTELEHLETCGVIFWDRDSNRFEFNKNHREWIITPIKGWNRSDFDKLLHFNIQEKFLKQEVNDPENFLKQEVYDSQNKKFEEEAKDETSQNKKSKRKKVLKLRSFDFLKQEVTNSLILYRSKDGWVPKDSIKDIKDKDIINNNNNDNAGVVNPFTFYEQNFEPIIPPAIIRQIDAWLDDFSEEMVVLAMERCLGQEDYKRKWSYINRILVNWHKKKLSTPKDVEADDEKFYSRMNNRNRQNRGSVEVVPEWFHNRDHSTENPEHDEKDKDAETEELKALIESYQRAGGN